MKKNGIETMEDRKVLREAMLLRGEKQSHLANKLGIRQPTLSANMNRTKMGLDTFAKILNAMDYDVAVIDRETGKVLWKVEVEE